MKIHFLGTNGWYSTRTGNTTCTLVESEKYYIIFDAGDGIYKIDRYIKDIKPVFLFLSHLHLDHIIGLHAFPKFKFQNKFTIAVRKDYRKKLLQIFDHPYAMPLRNLPNKIKILELTGRSLLPFPVEYRPLRHIDPALGFRISLDGKILVYCSDTGACDNTLRLAKGADILIHECSNQPGHSSGKWGHANPEEAAEMARKANVKKLILTHFSACEYEHLKEREAAQQTARNIFPATWVTRDGFTVKI